MRPYFVEVLGTPEAGKTSSIKSVKKSLILKGYSVCYIQEAAEVIPFQFPKGSLEAHLWMRLNVLQSILEARNSKTDIVICDRGIIDAFFWNQLYYEKGLLSARELDVFNEFVKSFNFMPQYAFILTTTPEEAIARRGGEGRLVTYDFICHFNHSLLNFCKQISLPHFIIDTTGVDKDNVAELLEKKIIDIFNK